MPEKPYAATDFVLTEEAAQKLVGQYGRYKTTYVDGKLFFNFNGATLLEMVAYSNTEFGFTKSAGSLTFDVDQDGNGTGLEVKLDAAGTRSAKRTEGKPLKQPKKK